MNEGGGHSRVFSVVSAPKAARKFDLADIPTLPIFASSRGGCWDREFQRYVASGDHSWFIPRPRQAVIKVFCYRESGAFPMEMVAKRCPLANFKPTPTTDYVNGIRVRMPQAAGTIILSARNMEPAQLSIPASTQCKDGAAGLGGLLHRRSAEGAIPPNRAGTIFLNWVRRAFQSNKDG